VFNNLYQPFAVGTTKIAPECGAKKYRKIS